MSLYNYKEKLQLGLTCKTSKDIYIFKKYDRIEMANF